MKGNSGPSFFIYDTAHLRNRYPEFNSKLPSNTAFAICVPVTNFNNMIFGQFCGTAPISILHRSMQSHVHLIIAMSSPSQIFNSIVRWVAVVMRNIRQIFRIRQKSNSNETMCCASIWFGMSRLSQHENDISKRGDCSWSLYRRFSGLGLWITPSPCFSSPATQTPITRNFVLGKFSNLFPLDFVHEK